jgi:molybdopterin-guanine dinucleotide biosynthesis protein A
VNAEENLPEVAGFVLAGGGSTRFGQDKALALVGETPMLTHLCSLFDGWTSDVSIVGSCAKYGGLGPRCVEDRWPGEGPLGGILTALLETAQPATSRGKPGTRAEWNLIVGCDMPFLTAAFLQYLAKKTATSRCEVIVPRSPHGPEPLCACWRTSAAPKLQAAFDSGVRKVTEAMKQLNMEVLDEADWKRFDSAGRLFWNINTQADYQRALTTPPTKANER